MVSTTFSTYVCSSSASSDYDCRRSRCYCSSDYSLLWNRRRVVDVHVDVHIDAAVVVRDVLVFAIVEDWWPSRRSSRWVPSIVHCCP